VFLHRLRELDELAGEHANVMAQARRLFHSNPTDLQVKVQRPFRQMVENVAADPSIRDIHTYIRKIRKNTDCNTDKYNILHRRYTLLGIASHFPRIDQMQIRQLMDTERFYFVQHIILMFLYIIYNETQLQLGE
jgi:hypothetical protein